MESMETLLYILVSCVGIILIVISLSHFNSPRMLFCITTVTIIILLGINILGQHTDIKELTVYQNGNIEVVGTNMFGSSKTERYSFSEYSITESDKNTCCMMREGTIKLTKTYYEQYKDTLKTEKSVNIKIEN